MLDNLTLDQMRVLIAVAEEGSFSAAARRLGRVQSAISQAIQTLEVVGLIGAPAARRRPMPGPMLEEQPELFPGDAGQE